MEGITICYRVDLVIQLIDTTTGKSISGKNIKFLNNGNEYTPIDRGNGNFVSVNTGREDFTLGINAIDYEPMSAMIKYDELDSKMPVKQIFLIPKENNLNGGEILSFTGNLEGIESIEGVCVSRTLCSISNFDERKRIMTIFHPQGGLTMGDVFYGLIKGPESYEKFEVIKEIPPSQVKIKKALENGFSVNAPISRVIFGQIEGNKYTFRVRNNASKLVFLICYVVNGEIKFKLLDFGQLENESLS